MQDEHVCIVSAPSAKTEQPSIVVKLFSIDIAHAPLHRGLVGDYSRHDGHDCC